MVFCDDWTNAKNTIIRVTSASAVYSALQSRKLVAELSAKEEVEVFLLYLIQENF